MGKITWQNQSLPSGNPDSGDTFMVIDPTTKQLKTKDDAGATKTYDDLPGTSAGDLIVHNGTQLERLSVGSDDLFLKANSGVTVGVSWATAGAGDVMAPSATATVGEIATFATTTGNVLSLSGYAIESSGAIRNISTDRYLHIPPSHGFVVWAEMLNSDSEAQGNFGWDVRNDGGTINWGYEDLSDNVHENEFGKMRMLIGQTSTSETAIFTDVTGFHLDNGAANVKFRADWTIAIFPSTSSNLIDVWSGFGDAVASTSQVDGAYFYWDGNTATFSAVTANNSTRTTEDTGITVTAGSPIHMRIEMDESAGEAKFYINNTLTNTINTNLPGNQRSFGWITGIDRIIGSATNRWVYVNSFYMHAISDTARYT